jgi:hypothetical protein
MAGCSTSVLVPTQLPACEHPEESQATGKSSANCLRLDERVLKTAEGHYVEHWPSDEDGKGGDGESSTKPRSGMRSVIAYQR